jgi:hypothetical protein
MPFRPCLIPLISQRHREREREREREGEEKREHYALRLCVSVCVCVRVHGMEQVRAKRCPNQLPMIIYIYTIIILLLDFSSLIDPCIQ